MDEKIIPSQRDDGIFMSFDKFPPSLRDEDAQTPFPATLWLANIPLSLRDNITGFYKAS
jgi:hypothetical protein